MLALTDSIQSSLLERFLKIPFKKYGRPRIPIGGNNRAPSLRKEFKARKDNPENNFKRKEGDPPTTIPLFSRKVRSLHGLSQLWNPTTTAVTVHHGHTSYVWFPCTSKYLCSDCVFPNTDLPKTQPSTLFYQLPRNLCIAVPANETGFTVSVPKCGYAAPCPGYEFIFAAWTTERISEGSTFGSFDDGDHGECRRRCFNWPLEFLQPPTLRARRVRRRATGAAVGP